MTNYQDYLLSRVLDYFEDEEITEKVHNELRLAIIHGDPEANYKGHPKMDSKETEKMIPISWVGDTRAHNALNSDYKEIWDEHHIGAKYLNRLQGMDLNRLYRIQNIGPRTFRIIREALDKYHIPYNV